MKNGLDEQYINLLKDILENGVEKSDRTGTGTISVFGRQIRHKMSEGFPLLTTKKMPWKTMVTELLWFLNGDTNIKYLIDNNCHIWDGDTYKSYLKFFDSLKYINLVPLSKEEFINKIKTDDEFAKEWGELGPIYGAQWRGWNSIDWDAFLNSDNLGDEYKDARHGLFYKEYKIDQLTDAINLLKTDPDSRRNRVSAWNVGDLPDMVLPPCHTDFQFYTRKLRPIEIVEQAKKDGLWQNEIPEGMTLCELQKNYKTRAISLMWNQRSVDTALGLPFNIASYGLLLKIIGKMVNMVPDELIGNLGDTHIYLNQVDGVKQQLTREPYPLPKLVISNQVNFDGGVDEFLNSCSIDNFKIENYQSHPTIKFPLSN
jgi:thymidylate synthase